MPLAPPAAAPEVLAGAALPEAVDPLFCEPAFAFEAAVLDVAASGAAESRSDFVGAPLHAANASATHATTVLVGRNNNILHQFSFPIARGLELRERLEACAHAVVIDAVLRALWKN